jgi:hypothetical protein
MYFKDIVSCELEKLEKLKSQHENTNYENIAHFKSVEYFINFLFSLMSTTQVKKIIEDTVT